MNVLKSIWTLEHKEVALCVSVDFVYWLGKKSEKMRKLKFMLIAFPIESAFVSYFEL